MSIFSMQTSNTKKSEAAVRWGNMFCIEKWKNFVDQANLSKVMLDLVWRDFAKFQWLGVHRRSERHYLILCSDWVIGPCLLSFYLTPWCDKLLLYLICSAQAKQQNGKCLCGVGLHMLLWSELLVWILLSLLQHSMITWSLNLNTESYPTITPIIPRLARLLPGADCKVSNTRMFQGQSYEGGT